jgi:hypothetical protein
MIHFFEEVTDRTGVEVDESDIVVPLRPMR